jgi:sugar phosphate isomerase/epimerase
MNCGAILLYAVRLGNGARLEYGSQETWDRFTAELTEVVPDAERAKVFLNPENVWNKVLLSPLEMRSFVDQFHSEWVGAHFDVGNCMQYGYPEDWILTLGKRIRRIHFKDFKLAGRGEPARFVDLLEGDVNWKAVMAALVKVGYNGFISPEIGRRCSRCATSSPTDWTRRPPRRLRTTRQPMPTGSGRAQRNRPFQAGARGDRG